MYNNFKIFDMRKHIETITDDSTGSNTVLATVTVRWIRIETPPPYTQFGKDYLVTVKCKLWDKPHTMYMTWHSDTVRGVKVERFKWLNRLVMPDWIITHWAELPEPCVG